MCYVSHGLIPCSCQPQFGRRPTPEQTAADPLLRPLDDPRNTQHGFAKSLRWELDQQGVNESGVCSVRFVLPPTAVDVPLPSSTVYYTLTLESNTLLTTLSVENGSDQSWKLKPGLHPYFKIRRNQVRVKGLEKGLQWVDGTKGGAEGTWSGGDVTWDAETGRWAWCCPLLTSSRARSYLTPGGHVLSIHDGASSFKMTYSGFTEFVEGFERANLQRDLLEQWHRGWYFCAGRRLYGHEVGRQREERFFKADYQDCFICIEPSYRNAWKELSPGETINASMQLEALSG